jgi:hypothetical protein
VTVIGAIGVGGGALTAFVGVADFLLADLWDGGGTSRSGTEFFAGVGVAAVGGVGLGTGIAGLKISARKHDDPLYYYDDGALRDRLPSSPGTSDASGLPGAARALQVHLVVGPGWLGATGTF